MAKFFTGRLGRSLSRLGRLRLGRRDQFVVPVDTTETGLGVQTAQVRAAVPGAESGIGTESVTLHLPLLETGSGTDQVPSLTRTLPESGSGSEQALVTTTATPGESGSGSDSATLLLQVSEAGVGNEGIARLHRTLIETGNGEEGVNRHATPAETGTGTEVLTQRIRPTETGTGSDRSNQKRTQYQFGIGTDSASVFVAEQTLHVEDSGTGVENGLAGEHVERGTGSDDPSLTAHTTATQTGTGKERVLVQKDEAVDGDVRLSQEALEFVLEPGASLTISRPGEGGGIGGVGSGGGGGGGGGGEEPPPPVPLPFALRESQLALEVIAEATSSLILDEPRNLRASQLAIEYVIGTPGSDSEGELPFALLIGL